MPTCAGELPGFAAVDEETRRTIAAPFFEDVAHYRPHEAPPFMKAAVAVTARNSLLVQVQDHSIIDSTLQRLGHDAPLAPSTMAGPYPLETLAALLPLRCFGCAALGLLCALLHTQRSAKDLQS
ncbi:hypothetical protein GCM10009745_70530 [Kribbella yunnanensis]|uniref:Uncharacterized protein n=1 Tax=Kribbella yunnanensis TaxID=190194 RepID=A0ABP4UUK5_9ACTN